MKLKEIEKEVILELIEDVNVIMRDLNILDIEGHVWWDRFHDFLKRKL